MAPPFLTSALVRGEWSASLPCSFTTVERAPGTHWIGSRVDPRVGLDTAKRKILHCQESIPGQSPSLYRPSYVRNVVNITVYSIYFWNEGTPVIDADRYAIVMKLLYHNLDNCPTGKKKSLL
jgi:hypothetical protein